MKASKILFSCVLWCIKLQRFLRSPLDLYHQGDKRSRSLSWHHREESRSANWGDDRVAEVNEVKVSLQYCNAQWWFKFTLYSVLHDSHQRRIIASQISNEGVNVRVLRVDMKFNPVTDSHRPPHQHLRCPSSLVRRWRWRGNLLSTFQDISMCQSPKNTK